MVSLSHSYSTILLFSIYTSYTLIDLSDGESSAGGPPLGSAVGGTEETNIRSKDDSHSGQVRTFGAHRGALVKLIPGLLLCFLFFAMDSAVIETLQGVVQQSVEVVKAALKESEAKVQAALQENETKVQNTLQEAHDRIDARIQNQQRDHNEDMRALYDRMTTRRRGRE